MKRRWAYRSALLELGGFQVNYCNLMLAMCFHGFIYSDEEKIRAWLTEHGINEENAEKIIEIAWESQRSEVPRTLEGKILHDAHVLEGGRTYLIIKTLITGSLRGQTLPETLKYMKNHVLDQNKCYLKETIFLCEEVNRFTNDFYEELVKEIS